MLYAGGGRHHPWRPAHRDSTRVLTEREEKNSVDIPSNDSFRSWTRTFTGPRLCAAVGDRLTFGGDIIETGTDSYRLAHAKATKAH